MAKDRKVKKHYGRKGQCQKCGRVFSSVSSLNRHYSQIHGDGYKKCICNVCGEGFNFPYLLRLHMMKHAETKNYECDVCGKTFFDKNSVRKHTVMHLEERPFTCNFCIGTFKRRCNMRDHELRVHGFVPDGYESHTCPVCEKAFLAVKRQTEPDTASPLPVKFCGSKCKEMLEKMSSSTNQLIKVKRIRRKNRNQIPGSTELETQCRTNRNQNPRPSKLEPKVCQCQVCGKVFKCEHYLNMHTRRVHDKDKYDKYCCNFCGKLFTFKVCFDDHIRIHTNSKPCICKVCNKAFRSSTCLSRHKKIHEDLRPYQCEVCGKAFKVKTHLQTHFRSHSGSKPYTCRFCEKAFCYNAEKKKHERNIHKIKTELETS